MSLTSCATLPMPSSEYLKDCKISYLKAEAPTNRDLLQLAEDRRFDTKSCNLDKAALRAWYEGYKASCGWRCRLRKD